MKKHFVRSAAVILFVFMLIIHSDVFAADDRHSLPGDGRDGDDDVPVFTDASVHDPSVIKVGDTFYIFGSHLTAAKSTDLMNWTTIASGVTDGNKLIPNVTEELKDTLIWAQADTLWAPDVIRLPDGKFYLYYDACKGDSPRSALGVAVSDNIEGPYKNLGIILKSGMWGEPSEDGTVYDATKHPNVVDPDVFYDKDGKLWMVYGSFSGGIFILKMDPATGMPFPGQGYGKKLTGGNHARIEGANMLYNPQTDYYYIFVTFGGLDSTGGYNIRVMRSRSPDGPYYDAEGNDMIDVKGAPGTIFDDASIAPYGVKLAGNYQFQRKIGDPGTGDGIGYVSPGGSTAYYDARSGRYFLIFHTRFPGRGEEHQVRVHQLLFNQDGWPVIAPYRYAGESMTRVDARQIPGDYKFVNHGKEITADIKQSVEIHLSKDGKITGAASGTWSLTRGDDVELTIGGARYDGVFLRQWDPLAEKYVPTFSALSKQGIAVWGVRMQDMNDHQIVNAVREDLSLGDTSRVKADLSLPVEGTHGAEIFWSSSNPDIVSSTGKVNRPAYGEGDASVTLTAVIRKGEVSATKNFPVTVLQHAKDGLVAEYDFEGNLNDSTGASASGTVIGDKIGTTGGSLSYADGVHGQAAVFDGLTGVRLADGLVSGSAYSVSLWVKPDQLTKYTTTFFGAKDANSWVSVVPLCWDDHTMLWSGSAWYDGKTGETIPVGQWTNLTFTVDNGNVKFYINGVAKFTGTGFPDVFTGANGTFALGVNWWDPAFQGKMDDVRIYEKKLTSDEVAALVDVSSQP